LARIENPDVAAPHGEVVLEFASHARPAILRREDFDNQKWWRHEYLFRGFVEVDRYIRHAKPGGRNLDTYLRKYLDGIRQQANQFALQFTVLFFAPISILQFSVHIVALRLVHRGQLLLDRHGPGGDAHVVSIAAIPLSPEKSRGVDTVIFDTSINVTC